MINSFYNGYRELLDRQLTSELNKEAIQMMGFDVLYIEKEYVDFDDILGEDREKKFKNSKPIEMYCENTQGFEGQGEMKSLFGNLWEAQGTFVVNKERFEEEFPDLVKPRAGDVLFMPYSKMLFEIKYVETEANFFPQSSSVVFKLKVENFKYSHEEISDDTSNHNDDDLLTDQYIGKLDDIIIKNPQEETGKYGDNNVVQRDYSNRFVNKKDQFRPKT